MPSNQIVYPPDALSFEQDLDVISSAEVNTLDELFRERVRRSSDQIAYTQFDLDGDAWRDYSWGEVAQSVARWQAAFYGAGLKRGDRVAICHRNSIEWVVFDQAALRLGLVVVPLYTDDRPDNMAYVISNSAAKLALFTDQSTWQQVRRSDEDISELRLPLSFESAAVDESYAAIHVDSWLPKDGKHFERGIVRADDLASVVYTSGTTGRPKGVMLSHKNMLSNAYSSLRSVAVSPRDNALSFLPLSHTLERTIGYYAIMMAGARTTYNRSIAQLADDLLAVKPTLIISVPRIFERVRNAIAVSLKTKSAIATMLYRRTIRTGWHRFQYLQGSSRWHPRLLLWPLLDRLVAKPIRQRFGGELRLALVGGAPLTFDVAKTFIGLGMQLLQGYGLTETSPVVSVNTLQKNRPDTIGLPLRGVEVRIGERDELLVRGDNVMQGYWHNDQATAAVMSDGWLHTGDCAQIDENGFLKITGRIKEILVLANGEKVPPADIEAAICKQSLIEQCVVLGEARSFLSALLVLNRTEWQALSFERGWSETKLNDKEINSYLIDCISEQMEDFPGYARVRRCYASLDEWTVESGLLTPTLKLRRQAIEAQYSAEIEQMYAGH